MSVDPLIILFSYATYKQEQVNNIRSNYDGLLIRKKLNQLSFSISFTFLHSSEKQKSFESFLTLQSTSGISNLINFMDSLNNQVDMQNKSSFHAFFCFFLLLTTKNLQRTFNPELDSRLLASQSLPTTDQQQQQKKQKKAKLL